MCLLQRRRSRERANHTFLNPNDTNKKSVVYKEELIYESTKISRKIVVWLDAISTFTGRVPFCP